jgi:hypothetical protein
MPTSPSATSRADVIDDDIELPVEVVAERLGLPVAMLVRRIEAGDIPARRVDDEHGVRYSVRIADLGTSSRAVMPPGPPAAPPLVHADAGRTTPHAAPRSVEPATAGTAAPRSVEPPIAAPRSAEPAPAATVAPRSPEAGTAAPVHTAQPAPPPPPLEDITEAIPPPPVRGTVELAPLDDDLRDPRAELAAVSLDPRELVAGLLDRWERTLEQRIYAEQRQRFEAELTNRQAQVKQLQLELEAVRAEHAAALAEKERLLAERMRELVERDRQLEDLREQPRRGWFFRR